MFSFFHAFGVKGTLFLALMTAGTLASASAQWIRPATDLQALAQQAEPVDETPAAAEKILSPQAAIAEAEKMAGTWAGKEKIVRDLMAAAKKDRNVIRQNCIEPKVAALFFWTKEGGISVAEMKSGVKQSSPERMALLLQKIRVIDSNIEEQAMEAGRCIGDEQFSSGEGFELTASTPDELPFDPDSPLFQLDDPLSRDPGFVPANPDWSVELTWPNASPYR